jgi:hypothetical protein
LKHLIVIGFLVICPDGPFPYFSEKENIEEKHRHKWNVPADLIARRHPRQIVVLALEPSRCTDTYRDFNLFSAL